jgi:hypothetical protein
MINAFYVYVQFLSNAICLSFTRSTFLFRLLLRINLACAILFNELLSLFLRHLVMCLKPLLYLFGIIADLYALAIAHLIDCTLAHTWVFLRRLLDEEESISFIALVWNCLCLFLARLNSLPHGLCHNVLVAKGRFIFYRVYIWFTSVGCIVVN